MGKVLSKWSQRFHEWLQRWFSSGIFARQPLSSFIKQFFRLLSTSQSRRRILSCSARGILAEFRHS
jgi:hypothetical protein